MSTELQQTVHFDVPPNRVFEALMDAEQHAAFTGGETVIDRSVGGAFSCHGGQIVGTTIDLAADTRIVQAWRVANWGPGVFSLVRITLTPSGEGTELQLDHTGIPGGFAEHLAAGWESRYWTPMTAYFAG